MQAWQAQASYKAQRPGPAGCSLESGRDFQVDALSIFDQLVMNSLGQRMNSSHGVFFPPNPRGVVPSRRNPIDVVFGNFEGLVDEWSVFV